MSMQIGPSQQAEDRLTLTPHYEELFCRLVSGLTGIMIHDHQLNALRKTVHDACLRFGHKSCEDYLEALKDEEGMSPHLEYLIAGITVGESYFFRDEHQISYLRDTYLPELIGRKRQTQQKRLRMWSAGCSEGQEIYTLAILLDELLPDIDDWSLLLLGTDINTTLLSKAMRGQYREWSLRATPDKVRERYFSSVGQEFGLIEKIRQRAVFTYLNLTHDQYPSILTQTNALDLILCRNVLIYLQRRAAEAIMKKFSSCLAPEGAIFLGAADPMGLTVPELSLQTVGKTFYYQQRRPPQTMPAADGDRQRRAGVAKKIRRQTRAVELAAAWPTRQPTSATSGKDQSGVAGGSNQPPWHPEIAELLVAERWSEVVEMVDASIKQEGEDLRLLQYKARAMANLGQLARAEQLFECILAQDPTDKHTYLIQSCVLTELNKIPEAEEALRKVIYLDPELAEAHYQVGLLRLRDGRLEAGLKSLQNALQLAEKSDPHGIVQGTQDVTYHRLAQILRNEIAMYSRMCAPSGNPRMETVL